jgi:hypothetical protein
LPIAAYPKNWHRKHQLSFSLTAKRSSVKKNWHRKHPLSFELIAHSGISEKLAS